MTNGHALGVSINLTKHAWVAYFKTIPTTKREAHMRHGGITFDISGDAILVQSPYHPQFVAGARNISGRWVTDYAGWTFPLAVEQRVRELCVTVYGTDRSDYTGVNVRIDAFSAWVETKSGSDVLYAFGRKVCSRRSRDSAIQLGQGVVLRKGTLAKSGGSMKYPSLDLDEDVELEILDVPNAHPQIEASWVSAVGEPESRAAILAERESLLKRIAALDLLLANSN